MNSKNTARIVAVLFIVALILPTPIMKLVDSILDNPDYLASVSENETQVIIGSLVELVNGILVAGIGIAMFPILRLHSASIALWYASFRVVEFVTHVVNVIGTLPLIPLSREYVKAGAVEASYSQALGNLILAERDWNYLIYVVVFCTGALMFYYSLYKSRLVPRFLSVWGLVATLALLTAGILGMFGLDYKSMLFMILAAPIALNELTLSIWLIVKGFNPTAIASGPAESYHLTSRGEGVLARTPR
jgi:hypothetical protein